MRGVIPATLSALALASCATPPPEPAPQAAQRFICDRSQTFLLRFAGKDALLTTDQGEARLASQPAGSGFLYSGYGQSIRGKGFELEWTRSDGTKLACREEKWAMQQPQIEPPAPSLAGTSWTLVSFQSSDDAIGTLIPPHVERYTLMFAADGKLAAGLDCNRAMGQWQVTSESAEGGSLAIQGGAMTRAMCGPEAIDTRIARDFQRIRSYTIRNGRLFLALEADAGIYEFRRN